MAWMFMEVLVQRRCKVKEPGQKKKKKKKEDGKKKELVPYYISHLKKYLSSLIKSRALVNRITKLL